MVHEIHRTQETYRRLYRVGFAAPLQDKHTFLHTRPCTAAGYGQGEIHGTGPSVFISQAPWELCKNLQTPSQSSSPRTQHGAPAHSMLDRLD